MSKKIIAVDFDGTLAIHKFPDIGEPVPLAIETCLELQKENNLILYTIRSGENLENAIKWCKEKGIEFWGINENPSQKAWSTSPKIYAHIYIDDAAFGCPLICLKEGRPYVDWTSVLNVVNAFDISKKSHK